MQLFGLIPGLHAFFVDLFADLPKNLLGGGPILEIKVAEIEEGKSFFFFLQRIMETLEATQLGFVFQEHRHGIDNLMPSLGLMLFP